MNRLVAVSVLLALLLASLAFAQDEEVNEIPAHPEGEGAEQAEAGHVEDEEDKSERGNEAAGVKAYAYFPGNTEHKFPAGEPVEVLVALDNSADQTFSVEFVLAWLTSVVDPTFYVANFTGSVYNRSVEGGSAAAVKYRFKPEAHVDPRDYNLLVQVFYQTEDNETYLSTAFNETVTITDPISSFDSGSIFGYILLAAAAGGAYQFYQAKFSKPSKPRKTSSVETGTRYKGIDLDYVGEEHLKFDRDNSRRSGSSSTSPTRRTGSK